MEAELMGSDRVTKRVWAQNVIVDELVLRGRLEALAARRRDTPDAEADAIEDSVRSLLDTAHDAAFRLDPQPWPPSNWWRGTLIELAHQNMHAARAQIVLLYDPAEVRAEIVEAVARAEEALHPNDPRLTAAHQLLSQGSPPPDRAAVSKIIEASFSAADQAHSRLRSFRNIIIITTLLLSVFLIAFVAYVHANPTVVPLCFNPTGTSGQVVCPTSHGQGGASGRDILAVTLIGLMGGALASAISIRNVRGTSTPYDIPVVLALLKIPAGALSAIAALIAIRGDFVPGLSALDSQEQILAYALVFGYAQQLLTRLIDRQGQELLTGLPSKDSQAERPNTVQVTRPARPEPDPTRTDAGTPTPPSSGDNLISDDDGDADASDIPDPEARDVPDGVIEDDTGTLQDLPDEGEQPDDGEAEQDPGEDDETEDNANAAGIPGRQDTPGS
jgi:hypothetical protein